MARRSRSVEDPGVDVAGAAMVIGAGPFGLSVERRVRARQDGRVFQEEIPARPYLRPSVGLRLDVPVEEIGRGGSLLLLWFLVLLFLVFLFLLLS